MDFVPNSALRHRSLHTYWDSWQQLIGVRVNYYHIWVNLLDSHRDLEFCANVNAYLGALQTKGLLEGFSITRRKFGFGPSELGEFHIVIDTKDLSQLEAAFSNVARRTGDIEDLHRKVYSAVTDFRSALYRDFPDPERVR